MLTALQDPLRLCSVVIWWTLIAWTRWRARVSALHHHHTGAWYHACPLPGPHMSKVTLSSHTHAFVMARFPVSISFRARQRAPAQVTGRERPFPWCAGEGKLFFFFYYWLAVVKCRVWFASVAKLVGAVARVWLFCTVLGWKGKKEGMAFSRDLMLAAL